MKVSDWKKKLNEPKANNTELFKKHLEKVKNKERTPQQKLDDLKKKHHIESSELLDNLFKTGEYATESGRKKYLDLQLKHQKEFTNALYGNYDEKKEDNEPKDENAGKTIQNKPINGVPSHYYGNFRDSYTGITYHYWTKKPSTEEKMFVDANSGRNSNEHYWTDDENVNEHWVKKAIDLNKDENAGKEIANNKKVSTRIGDESIVHLWEKKPTNEEIAKQEENYKEHNKPQFHYVKDNYEENLRKRKNADYTAIDNWKDENADKNIETSQENGYSEEQAKAVPNDTLVKDDKDADIKTDDASPKNLEEIKDGNLDAKISPDSDFKLSPEMEKWLIANGWKKPEKK